MTLTLVDFFCGAGGSSQGAAAVPGIEVRLAANHWARAIESHAANFPSTEHYRGDLHDADVARFPSGDLFWVVPDAAMIMRNNTARSDPGCMSTPATEPLRTLTSAGHQSLVSWANLLVPYYGNAATAQPVSQPVGTLSTRDRFGFASGSPEIAVDDVLFRMLKPPEIGRAMAFGDAYVVLGTQREKVRQYGNAVTPPVAEVLFSALVEAITGDDLGCAA